MQLAAVFLLVMIIGCLIAAMFFFIAFCFYYMEGLCLTSVHEYGRQRSDHSYIHRRIEIPDAILFATTSPITEQPSTKSNSWTLGNEKTGSVESLPPSYDKALETALNIV